MLPDAGTPGPTPVRRGLPREEDGGGDDGDRVSAAPGEEQEDGDEDAVAAEGDAVAGCRAPVRRLVLHRRERRPWHPRASEGRRTVGDEDAAAAEQGRGRRTPRGLG